MFNIIVYIAAGLFAGVGTGLVGLSAAAIIVPLLSTIAGIDPYVAIGIALASDVLASATSTVTYAKNKNLDIKNGLVMMASVLVFTVLTSYIASLNDTTSIGSIMNVIVIILGINFIRKSLKEKAVVFKKSKNKIVASLLWGSLIGIICGYVGAGGGIMLLVVLTGFLGYDTKIAVGTSLFIMTFTALFGSVSHIIIAGTEIVPLIICIVAAFIGAKLSAIYANKVNISKLNRIVGIFLIVFGIVLTFINQLA